MSHLDIRWVITGDSSDDLTPPEPLCLAPSPGGAVVCTMAADHVFDQHASFDRSGCLRGWRA